MNYFRFLTKIKGQQGLLSLVFHSATASEALKSAKAVMAPEEIVLAVNVLRDGQWVVVKGPEIKNKTINPHPGNTLPESEASPLGDALEDGKARKEINVPNIESGSGQGPSKTDAASADTSSSDGDTMALLLSATAQAIIVCLVRVFTIPWTIWKGSALRLAEDRGKNDNPMMSSGTEFPVFEWMKSSWDGVIFLSWFFGPILAIIIGNSGYQFSWGSFWFFLVSTYFGVIALSITKEMLTLLLSIALNVEKLSFKAKSSN